MDENSEAHMETDVSSTTDDVPGTQEVTGSHGDVEMVIVVEKVEEDSSIDATDDQLGSDISSASKIKETSPQKVSLRLPQKIPKASPVKDCNLSQSLMQPLRYESVKSLDKNQESTNNKQSPVKQQLESACSTKIETPISKSLNKDSQIPFSSKISPVKQQPESSNKDSIIYVTNNISPIKLQSESSDNSKTSNLLSKTSQITVSNKTSPVKQPESSNISAKMVTKISPEKNTEISIGRSPKAMSQDQKIISNSPYKEVKVVSRPPIKLIRIRGISTNKDTNTQEKATKTIQENQDKEDKSQSSNKEIKSPIKPMTNMQQQVSASDSSPTKKEDKSNMEEKLQIKSPTKEKLIEAPGTEIKLEENSIKESKSTSQLNAQEKLLDSTKVIQSEASTSDKSNCKSNVPDLVQSKVASASDNLICKSISTRDTSITNSVPIKTVIVEKIDTSLSADDTLSTTLNNSQSISLEVTEKEHNKSISRELKSLIKSAKDSKIISECTQLKTKTRKSRQDISNTSLNVSIEAEKIGYRRCSSNSLVSNSSEKSDRSSLKRSMRSQNPEFVNKCKQFLNSVTSRVTDFDEPMSEDEESTNSKDKSESSKLESSTPKKKKFDQLRTLSKNKNSNSDCHCWRCHWTVEQEDNDKAHPPLECTLCPRSFHYKCLSTNERKTPSEKKWVCPDCLQILQAESSDTRSPAMKKTSLGMLCDLLKYALERMMDLNGVEPFIHPVDRTLFPDYDKYVIHPMDLTQMKQNIADGLYGSTEAFVADAQWILHNSIIFNTCEQAFLQSKLTGGARALVRSCRAEMGEIEACPECYAAAHARKPTWFTDVCTTPHILLWAKLKGFPYWPAKGMTVNSSGLVDVRFFGAHDRAWVPAKDCFLFSEKDPNNFRNKRQDILDSMKEAEQHIRNISRKYGKFVYPPFKTQFDPSIQTEQIKMMIPSFEGELKSIMKDKSASASPLTTAKENRRSASKGSKSSANDDGSESEDASTSAHTEALKRDKEANESDNEDAAKVDSPMILNVTPTQELDTISTRKRRRSHLEEAVMTVIETSTTEKKKRIDIAERKKTDTPEQKKKTDSTEQKKKSDSSEQKKKSDSTEQKKKRDSLEQKKQEQQEPSSSREEKVISKEMEVTESTSKKRMDTSKSKSRDEEPSSSTMEERESLRVTPIKLVALPRANKQTPKLFAATKVPSKPSSPKEDDKTPHRAKSARSDKASTSLKAKDEKGKAVKRRNSRANKSLNTSTPKSAKIDNDATSKELRPRDRKNKDEVNKVSENSLLKPTIRREINERLQFDDDTSLAVIAQKRRSNTDGLPTISSVCSLSTTANATSTINTTSITSAKTIEINVEASSTSSVFTPTSTDNVRNMKEAATKLQKIKDNTEPVVGRVGVRAFARMTSPERNDNVQVEIKAEPVDLDDEDRHNEKMDLMNACNLQPVNPPQSLRNVRINRVTVGPSYVVKSGKVESRARAKKSFPTPRRAEEGRSELNGKNSMVYIPIQPPATQAPVRAVRPALPTGPRPTAPLVSGNNTVNTMTTPLKPITSTLSSPSIPMPGQIAVAGQVSVPTVGQVPTTVHTVPLMTSVNGQWMFSLQPVMSVGGVDTATSPMVNGISDRGVTPNILPLSSTATPNSVSAPSTPAQQNRTNDTPAELPRLQQRPTLQNPLDPNSVLVATPTPSAAGPITAKLNQNAVKLADFFRTLLEDSIEKIDEPSATATGLKKQLEQARWRHQHEIDELKHNHELTLAEMRLSFEKDKVRVVGEMKRTAQLELEAAVKLAKSKQWCANCTQEAQFYCCWNTAYCDYPCQRAHWPHHFANCAQRPKDGDDESSPEPRLQSQSDNMPALQKSVPAATPALTVGGKLANSRVFASPEPAQKASIIVSMVEDNSGNQTMKCVGTYKPSTQQAQLPPLIINKQVVNDDGKQVVTSGGYLIVGSAGNNASVITPAPSRRHHAIQYYS